MLYVHVSRGIVARCKTVAEYEEWMDQREVWDRHRLRIIEEREAFGIVHSGMRSKINKTLRPN